MPQPKTLGYIVECANGGGMGWLKNNGSDAKRLPFALYFNYITIFPTREAAKRAIATTLRFDETFETRLGKLTIRRAINPPIE